MELRVSTDRSFNNIDIIRRVVEESEGTGAVEFSNGSGAGNLMWSRGDGKHTVRIAIPLGWLMDNDKADRVEQATRHFMNNVRTATR